ncbi:TetR/AcrR family transcriptional regulator [uncultured Arthrobacter sp.]|uniref:TetR/AcrR family transcriptional regulator n=1 Tax=uncultured Arthrobacter sp. TaxID=114050 RepID=UPI002611830C|nr:TetR/AcrR family transcriptional regulator [uncultured Arthrobacter sp.]
MMPKIVDHESRRRDIVEAVLCRIEAHGFASVSVRNLAADLNVSPSAIRHYFSSSEQMLASTMQVVREAQAKRLGIGVSSMKDWDVREAWLQALPLDGVRRREAVVWLSMMMATHSPDVRAVLAEANADLDHLCRVTVEQLGCRESIAIESKALRAFTDGLTLNAIADPQAFDSDLIVLALDTYFTRITAAFAA